MWTDCIAFNTVELSTIKNIEKKKYDNWTDEYMKQGHHIFAEFWQITRNTSVSRFFKCANNHEIKAYKTVYIKIWASFIQ